MGNRRFAAIQGYQELALPQRKTALSAGYDFAAAANVQIPAGKIALVPTGLKAYMEPGDVLVLSIRSSLAVKWGLMLANGIGVIDADYVDNPENEGHIQIALFNASSESVSIRKGERIAQGIFLSYLLVDDDQGSGVRTGGFGSTGSG